MSTHLDTQAIRRYAELIRVLPNSLKESYEKHLSPVERLSRAQQLVGDISVGLLPAVAVLEVRQPYAADLLKRRLAFMEHDALRLSRLEVPDFEKPRGPDAPVSEGAWEYGTFLVFCKMFAVSVQAIAAEFEADATNSDSRTRGNASEKPPWYKLTAPPKGEYYETRLVGTVNELTKWNNLKKAASLKLKVEKEVLWIMLEPDGRFACYFRTREQYQSAASRREATGAVAKVPPPTTVRKAKPAKSAAIQETQTDQKRPKRHQPRNSRRKTK